MGRTGHRRGPRVAKPKPEGPTRTCIGTREQQPRGAMVRLVVSPEGRVLVDRHLKAPGRGAHLSYSAAAIEAAVKRKALQRAFKGALTEAPDVGQLTGLIVEAIEARVEDALRLGRRARRVISGTDRVLEALKRGKASLVILAEDAAGPTAERITRTAESSDCHVVVWGDKARLGALQGPVARVALAVTGRRCAETVRQELDRRSRVLVAA